MNDEQADPVRVCVDCRIRFDAADVRCDALWGDLSGALKNIGGAEKFATRRAERRFHPAQTDWIDAISLRADVLAAMTEWHDARADLIAAFAAVPESMKAGLAPLPDHVRDHLRSTGR